MTADEYKFDFALSFAGPQRDLARRLRDALTQAGFQVFFDEDYQHELLGQDATLYLRRVYSKESRYGLILISEEYDRRDWPSLEREAIQSREVAGERYVFIPVVTDRHRPEWLPASRVYFDLSQRSISDLVDLLQRRPGLVHSRSRYDTAMDRYHRTDYDGAREILRSLDDLGDAVPSDLRFRILYNLACAENRIAERAAKAGDSGAAASASDAALDSLRSWIIYGKSIGWSVTGYGAEDAIGWLCKDDDLFSLIGARAAEIQELIPKPYLLVFRVPEHPSGERLCVASGSLVTTPTGDVTIEDVSVGTEIFAIDMGDLRSRIYTKITHIKMSRVSTCIHISDEFVATSSQPVYEEQCGWLPLGDVKPGMRLLRGDGSYAEIERLERITGDFEVYELSIDHPSHNFIAGGFVCHNIK